MDITIGSWFFLSLEQNVLVTLIGMVGLVPLFNIWIKAMKMSA